MLVNTPQMAAVYLRKYLSSGEHAVSVVAIEDLEKSEEDITHRLENRELKTITAPPEDEEIVDFEFDEIEIEPEEGSQKKFYSTEIEEVEDDFDY